MQKPDVATKVVTLKDGRTRHYRSEQLRRQIVEETLKPGASVALVARTHGVNANQVLKWRRRYERERHESEAKATLLPVKISSAIPATESRPRRKAKRSGLIDIDLGHARVRIEGNADPDCVRAVVEGLLR